MISIEYFFDFGISSKMQSRPELRSRTGHIKDDRNLTNGCMDYFSRDVNLPGLAWKAEAIVTRMGRDWQGQARLSAAK